MATSGSGSATSELGTGWPTPAEVTDRLEEMGVTNLPSSDTLQSLIDAKVQQWEDYTGFSPFLSEGEETTEIFAICGGIVDFRGGVIGTPSTFTIGGYYDENGDYTGGEELVIHRDYELMRPRRTWPYTYAKLIDARYIEDTPNGAEVTADFGFADTVPPSAWEAVMEDVLGMVVLLNQSNSGAVVEKEQRDQRVKYADTSKVSGQGLSDKARMAANLFRRMEIA